MASNGPRDTFSRPITDLRISVTDRCNFRCPFCMPAAGKYHFLPKKEILSFEETVRLARLFVGLGVRKMRLTGGEPLLRSELSTLIAALAQLRGVEDLALTTNGYLLEQQAAELVQAGLRRVTVSLHSLEPETFRRLNGLGIELQRVLDGIAAARRAGLDPVKLNVVAIRGQNEHELLDIVRFGREQGCVVRFIEYMDVGTVNRWEEGAVLSAREIVDNIDRVFPLEPVGRLWPGEVAERYRFRDGGGEIGVIPSITQPFCGDCSRVRLSAEGQVYTCLFSKVGHDLKSPLRAGESDEQLQARLRQIWQTRTDRYSEERTEALRAGTFQPTEKVEMFRIGG